MGRKVSFGGCRMPPGIVVSSVVGTWYADLLALKHESRSSDIAGMWKNPVAHFQASLVKPRQAGAQTVRNEKQAMKTLDTTQKYLIFLLSRFRTRMSASE